MSSKPIERATFAVVGAVGACVVWRILQTKRNMELEIVQLREMLETAGRTVDILKKRSDAQNTMADRSQKLIHDYINLRKEREALKESLNKEAESRIQAEEKEKELELEMEHWLEDHEVARSENRKCIELEIEVNVKQTRIKEMEDEKERVKADLVIAKHEYERTITDLENKEVQLKRNTLEFETMIKEYKDELTYQRKENDQLQKHAKETEAELKRLQMDNKEAINKLNKVEERLETQQKEYMAKSEEMMQKLHNETETRISVEREMQLLQDKERNLLQNMEQSKEEKRHLHVELQSKTQIISKLEDDASKQTAALTQLQSSLHLANEETVVNASKMNKLEAQIKKLEETLVISDAETKTMKEALEEKDKATTELIEEAKMKEIDIKILKNKVTENLKVNEKLSKRNAYLEEQLKAVISKLEDDDSKQEAARTQQQSSLHLATEGMFHTNDLGALDRNAIQRLDDVLQHVSGTPVLFADVGSLNYYMSNFAPSKLSIRGVTYNCVEQFYQSSRAEMAGRSDLHHQIMQLELTEGSNKAQEDMIRLGRKAVDNRLDLQKQWDQGCLQLMYEAVTAKFEQNINLREQLLATGCRSLGDASFNRRWGIMMKLGNPRAQDMRQWEGHNFLGKTLMLVRHLMG